MPEVCSLRTLTRPAGLDDLAPLNWRLEDLKVGDQLFVPYQTLPFGKAYAYIKHRASVLERYFKVERNVKGTLATRVGSKSEVRVRQEKSSPRPADGDWGIIEREPNHYWHYPFKDMEPGDIFRIDPADRTRRQLDNAAQKAKTDKVKFRVLESPLRAPGYFLIECIEQGNTGHGFVSFGTVRERLLQCFEPVDLKYAFDDEHDRRLDLNKVEWSALAMGEKLSIAARVIVEPPRSCYVFVGWVVNEREPNGDDGRFALDMYQDHIEIERVADNMTDGFWQLEKRKRVEEALS